MRTRSQSNSLKCTIDDTINLLQKVKTDDITELFPLYEVNIDFDGAQKAWLANKKRQPNATYKYICLGQTKTGRSCNKNPLENSNYCSCHK